MDIHTFYDWHPEYFMLAQAWHKPSVTNDNGISRFWMDMIYFTQQVRKDLILMDNQITEHYFKLYMCFESRGKDI